MAYVNDRNIDDNARAHRRSKVILKLDFKDFFPSITPRDWANLLGQAGEDTLTELALADGNDRQATVRLLFWGRGTLQPTCLSIGAPSSPMMSNIIMFGFDQIVAQRADELGVTYTRYADDITLSASRSDHLIAVERSIGEVISRMRFPRLQLNADKRGLYTSGQRRMVTGLVVTPERHVSIGRKRKRTISSLVHRYTLNKLDMQQIGYLKGMLGFAVANEPEVLDRLRRKYGSAVITQLLSVQLPPRPRA